jgi:hypothetical protein
MILNCISACMGITQQDEKLTESCVTCLVTVLNFYAAASFYLSMTLWCLLSVHIIASPLTRAFGNCYHNLTFEEILCTLLI